MKFLFASDSFKGTLSSKQTAQLLTKAAQEVFGPSIICDWLPVADGGEGTTEAVVSACNGKWIQVTVEDPLGNPVKAQYGDLGNGRAVMEMAQASGLPLVPEDKRNPLKTSTFGTGQLLLDAINKGFTDISIAIGGSATNDGGTGCMQALGVRFLDSEGKKLKGCGQNLEKICRIDVSGLDSRIKNIKFTVMCDVKNPLCGKNGATYTFGSQKGASPEALVTLEKGMCNYRDLIKAATGIDCDAAEGAGAAGGLGAALLVFLKANLKSGIETVLDLCNFDRRLEGVNLVVTGEGRTDWQSAFGKVMFGVGEHCKARNIPVVALVGSMGKGAEAMYDHGITSILTTVSDFIPLEQALANAEAYYYSGALRLFRLIKAGTRL